MTREDDFRYVFSNFDLKSVHVIQRDIHIPLKTSRIVAVTGPRRAGKTYCLFGMISNLNAVPSRNILYVNFESERLRNLDANDLETMMKVFYEMSNPDPSKPVYLFLDEIQNVKDWDRWVRSIADRKKFNIYISGSSSRLLSREIATALRGRSIDFMVLPLSFKEFLKFEGVELGIGELERIGFRDERGILLNRLDEYIRWGAYPEIVLESEESIKSKILESYYQSTVYRDIGERTGINQSIVSESLLYFVHNYSKYVSISKTYNYLKGLGYRVSKQTLIEVLNAAREAYLLFTTEIYSKSAKNRTQYPKKVYVVDAGMVRAAKAEHSTGRLMENTVMLELVRRLYGSGSEIYYWKEYGKAEGAEVDFVIKEGI
ncbi:MAG: ATP-binding protein, partial [Nitrososphaeria archaeon]